jgi:PPOX class probable F420-dependent enzyme
MSTLMTPQKFASLRGYKHINLVTFRKNGQGVTTTVWFVASSKDESKLYIFSESTAGKLRRIQNYSQVEIAPSTISGKTLGPSIKARARILSTEESRIALQELNRKYGLIARAFNFLGNLHGTKRVYLELILTNKGE